MSFFAFHLSGADVGEFLSQLRAVPLALGTWAYQNQAYALGVVLGFAFGVFYGFDGWSGSLKDVEFKDSPRVKNLIWVVTGAVAAVFGDVHVLDAGAEKGFLLVVYTLAFVTSSTLVVLFYAVLVGIDSIQFNRRFEGTYGFIDALGDYLHFGYRAYRDGKLAITAGLKNDFNAYYLEQLSYALLIASSQIVDSARLSAARNVLRLVALVTQRLRGGTAPGSIRTNLMLARAYRHGDQVAYMALGAPPPAHVLVLVAYDSDAAASNLVLPLPDSERQIPVPGGPSVFVSGTPGVVDDTAAIEYPLSLNSAVRHQMQTYFADKERTFRSFSTLRIVAGGKALGVLNVDCTELEVLGKGTDEQLRNIRYLLPFAAALGSLYKDSKESHGIAL